MANRLKLVFRGLNPFKMKKEPTKTEQSFTPPTNINKDPSFFENLTVDVFQQNLDSLAEGEAHDMLKAWLDSMIRENGISNTAKMLNDGADAGNFFTWEIAYKKDKAVSYINNMMDYMPEQGVMYKDRTLDKLEYMKEFGNALEQSEDWEQPD